MDDKKVISIIEDLIFEDINQEDYWIAVKEAEDLIKKVKAKQLKLHNVNQQRELLINFLDWYNEDEEKTPITEDEIDLFIKEKIK